MSLDCTDLEWKEGLRGSFIPSTMLSKVSEGKEKRSWLRDLQDYLVKLTATNDGIDMARAKANKEEREEKIDI